MNFIRFDEARKAQKSNLASRWHKAASADVSQDVNTASYRYSERYFRPILGPPKFQIERDERFFMIGSCFARGIESALAHRKLNVLSLTNTFNRFATKGVGTQLGVTNRYNLGSIRNEFAWALKEKEFPDAAMIEVDDGLYSDPHSTPVFPPASHNEVKEKRRLMGELVSRVRECDVVIVTLGLIEVWKDAELNLITNAMPTAAVVKKHPDRFLFGRLGYAENLGLLHEVYDLLTSRLPSGFRMVVTVSPVPLDSTFTDRDVVEATTYSKSLLRVVAEDFAAEKPNVEYFPSYEIVMNSPRPNAWMEDCRHVRGELANFVAGQFINHFIPQERVEVGERLVTATYVE